MHLFLIVALFLITSQAIALPAVTKQVHSPREQAETTCVRCHGNRPPISDITAKVPPLLSSAFSMDWVMYEFKSEKRPPFEVIPKPNRVSRGHTYYDFLNRKMTELYEGRCINIFPSGNNFSCQFLSDQDRTYFIQFPLGDFSKPKSCCLWAKESFWAPRPDILFNMNFQKEMRFNGEIVNFWILDIPMPGPFGYGTTMDGAKPVTFWFPVIEAWVQQNFFNYVSNRPDPRVFQIPQICQNSPPVCSQE